MIATYRKGSLWEYLAVAGVVLLLVVRGLYVTDKTGLLPSGTYLAVAVCLAFAAFLWRGLWDKRTILSIEERGVWFAPWSLQQPVPLRDIVDVTELTAPKGEPFIALVLAPDSTVHADPLAKAHLHQSRGFTRRPALLLRCTLLSVTNREVLETLRARVAAAR